jgi:hypothetical protein
MPDWFVQCDTDRDGQVALYEWKAAGGPVLEFERMDLNHDGFVTAEELLRYHAAQAKAQSEDGQGFAFTGAPRPGGRPQMGNRGNRGGNNNGQQRGAGRGGRGAGGPGGGGPGGRGRNRGDQG